MNSDREKYTILSSSTNYAYNCRHVDDVPELIHFQAVRRYILSNECFKNNA